MRPITETNGIDVVLFGMQNRTLVAISGIFISTMSICSFGSLAPNEVMDPILFAAYEIAMWPYSMTIQRAQSYFLAQTVSQFGPV
jgi:hypothetical protein